MVTFWLNGEETSSETESAVEQGGAGQDLTESNFYLTKQGDSNVLAASRIEGANIVSREGVKIRESGWDKDIVIYIWF